MVAVLGGAKTSKIKANVWTPIHGGRIALIKTLTTRQILERLRLIQQQRKFGDRDVALDRVARLADVDPTTIRALLRGENSMNVRTQIKLSRALEEMPTLGQTKLGHISLGPNGPKIGFGVGRGRLLE